ncbi:DUF6221 family protein [Streptomyces sp. NBC_00102]|uniref:DUF6221 family protein n=1 Tax=Streptomyces sp. NBC_00102 TaxID=2975652 RepID=UPI0022506C88|nr:DUF6221 family protein [Streptomyces sp. NBC_00102]MCX5401488.1 DUF6221 family protein [Streptomyces sp. NBC_00102]
MSDALVAFLLARLAEREAAALAASGGRTAPSWQALGTGVYAVTDAFADDVPPLATTGPEIGGSDEDAARAEHIALHDPAHTLREIEAVRELLRRYEEPEASFALPDSANRYSAAAERSAVLLAASHLALPYSGHPDYLVTWRP